MEPAPNSLCFTFVLFKLKRKNVDMPSAEFELVSSDRKQSNIPIGKSLLGSIALIYLNGG